MKLSLKVDYACRVLARLGRSYGGGALTRIEELARVEEVPANYLVQILNELRTAGLITSRRGQQGGYALALPPGEVTLNDIVRAVEGEVLDTSVSGKGASGKRVAAMWGEVASCLEAKTRAFTVAELIVGEDEEMWYI